MTAQTTVSLDFITASNVLAFFDGRGDEMARKIAATAAKVVKYLDRDDPANAGALVPISVEMYFDTEAQTERVRDYLRGGKPREVWQRGMPQPMPEVGMAASYCILGDAYPGEISHVSRTGHKIGFKHAGNGDNNNAIECTRRKDGKYRPAGSSSAYILIGKAISKRDPHV